MTRTIIVDDEVTARAALKGELTQYCPQLEIIAECSGMHSAVETINKLKPELVFLDIQLGDGTGFGVLEKLEWKNARIIFVTAYDEYAVQAFKVNATDYLLKPVDPAELTAAVDKALQKNISVNEYAVLGAMMEQRTSSLNEKIAIPQTKNIVICNRGDIVRIEALQGYSRIFMASGEKILSSRLLKDFEEMLHPHGFERVHHSYLVNLAHIRKFSTADGITLMMSDGETIPVSQRKKMSLLKLLEHISI
jgi:two-component system, LytTR family, response regulator